VPGGATVGIYTMTATLYVDPNDPRPAVHDFATKYEKQFGHPPNFAAEIGYSAAQVVVLALQKAGRALTADTFIAALESIKDYKDIFGSPTMSLARPSISVRTNAF
jgi:branched-chain amino acid transport system substrate-binding protein